MGPADAAVEYESVGYRYPGADVPALEGVSLRVEVGERLGILGPNGGGKSTLLRLTLGLLGGYSGRIRVFGVEPEQARRAGLVGYVPQRVDVEMGFPLSVRQVVTLGAAWGAPAWRAVDRGTRERVDHLLDLVGGAGYAERAIGGLSGGQMQRVMIARALAARPRILAMDEPTVGIDAAGQRTFADLLARVHTELGVTMLTVSHDLRAIVAGSDRVACLARRLHSHVSPEGLTPQVLAELFSHDVAGVLAGVHVHAHGTEECGACAAEAEQGTGHPHGHAHTHPHAASKPDPMKGGSRADA